MCVCSHSDILAYGKWKWWLIESILYCFWRIYVNLSNFHSKLSQLKIISTWKRERDYSLMLCCLTAMTDRSTADMLFNELKLMNFSLLLFPRRYWNTSSIARISTSPSWQWTRCRRSIDCWCKLCPQCHMPACK